MGDLFSECSPSWCLFGYWFMRCSTFSARDSSVALMILPFSLPYFTTHTYHRLSTLPPLKNAADYFELNRTVESPQCLPRCGLIPQMLDKWLYCRSSNSLTIRKTSVLWSCLFSIWITHTCIAQTWCYHSPLPGVSINWILTYLILLSRLYNIIMSPLLIAEQNFRRAEFMDVDWEQCMSSVFWLMDSPVTFARSMCNWA